MYLEGSDQHRGWFQSSLLLSLAGNGMPPYRNVLTHGFMVDADREKISKSKQGQGELRKAANFKAYIKYGADVVRLWLRRRISAMTSLSVTSGSTRSRRRIASSATRCVISFQMYDFDPGKHTVAADKLTPLDRWILVSSRASKPRLRPTTAVNFMLRISTSASLRRSSCQRFITMW